LLKSPASLTDKAAIPDPATKETFVRVPNAPPIPLTAFFALSVPLVLKIYQIFF